MNQVPKESQTSLGMDLELLVTKRVDNFLIAKKTMSWIESINMRLTRPDDISKVYRVFQEVKQGLSSERTKVEAKLYKNTKTLEKWSIHLLREFSDSQPEKTILGYNVASFIRSFGDVDHMIWKKAC